MLFDYHRLLLDFLIFNDTTAPSLRTGWDPDCLLGYHSPDTLHQHVPWWLSVRSEVLSALVTSVALLSRGESSGGMNPFDKLLLHFGAYAEQQTES